MSDEINSDAPTYRLVWCRRGDTVQSEDGLTETQAYRMFASVLRECAGELDWLHILRLPDRTIQASIDRAELQALAKMRAAVNPPQPRGWRPVDGGELAPEDIA